MIVQHKIGHEIPVLFWRLNDGWPTCFSLHYHRSILLSMCYWVWANWFIIYLSSKWTMQIIYSYRILSKADTLANIEQHASKYTVKNCSKYVLAYFMNWMDWKAILSICLHAILVSFMAAFYICRQVFTKNKKTETRFEKLFLEAS